MNARRKGNNVASDNEYEVPMPITKAPPAPLESNKPAHERRRILMQKKEDNRTLPALKVRNSDRDDAIQQNDSGHQNADGDLSFAYPKLSIKGFKEFAKEYGYKNIDFDKVMDRVNSAESMQAKVKVLKRGIARYKRRNDTLEKCFSDYWVYIMELKTDHEQSYLSEKQAISSIEDEIAQNIASGMDRSEQTMAEEDMLFDDIIEQEEENESQYSESMQNLYEMLKKSEAVYKKENLRNDKRKNRLMKELKDHLDILSGMKDVLHGNEEERLQKAEAEHRDLLKSVKSIKKTDSSETVTTDSSEAVYSSQLNKGSFGKMNESGYSSSSNNHRTNGFHSGGSLKGSSNVPLRLIVNKTEPDL